MSSPIPVPVGGNQDRGQAAVVTYWTQTAIAMVIVAGRFYARRLIRSTGADDWFMLATLVIFTVISCLVTYQASLGGFRHLYYLQPQHLSEVFKLNYIMQVLGIFSYVTAKASVGLLILRIMGPNSFWRRRIIWFLMIFTFIVNSINCILTFAQCDPPRALWEPNIPAHCWDPKVQSRYAYFVSSENILADVALSLIPVTIIWNLSMSRSKRLNLSILLSLSLLAAVAGIIKTTFLAELNAHSDLTWETYRLIVWSGAEDFVIIVCGSIPPLKPLWDHYVTKKKNLSKASYQKGSGPDSYSMGRHYVKPNEDSLLSSQASHLGFKNGNDAEHGILASTSIEIHSERGSVV